ncbi:MAG TPA: 3-oxoacyl-ACP reductase family protein [Candidatus Hydrogenedentes bacterium]|nr:3-oxoacyl-ACP reductase family protein [Candidatus Hydrogenedentota bacterium]
MSKPLQGKVAIVTGASRGIGAAIAMRLADEGAAVAITYSSSASKAQDVLDAIHAKGGRAIAIQADSADASALQAAIAKAVSMLGRLDILVNNAGIALMGTVESISLEEFDRLLHINIRAIFVGIQEASKHMGEGGSIISIGSCTADRMPFPGGGAYAMSKAAIAALTRGLSRDFGPRGITVNNVQPGPIDTDMNPAEGRMSKGMKSATALKAFGKSEDVAALVAFLAGPEARFVTGASLSIDGGFTA